MSRILQVLNIFFSAALLALAIPNELYHFGNPSVGFIALIPFYAVFTEQKTYTQSALHFALLTFLTQLFSSYWLGFFKEFAFVTLFFTCFGTSIIGFSAGLLLHVPFAGSRFTRTLRISESPLYSPFIPKRTLHFTAAYTVYEWMKSVGFLGYPWGTVYMAHFRFTELIQIADITGTYGITFLSVMFSALAYESRLFYVQNNPFRTYYRFANFSDYAKKRTGYIPLRRTAVLWLCLFSLALAYGTFQCSRERTVEKYLNTIMVQQNKDPWSIGSDNETIRLSMRLTMEQIEEAKKLGEEVDLVVWSEGCLKYSFPSAAYHYKNFPSESPLKKFVADTGVPFIFGGSYVINESPRQAVNATLLYDEKGEFRGYYGKLHLVPFAEIIPFSDRPRVARFLRNTIGISGWHPGLQYVFYDIQGRHPEERPLREVNVISLEESLEQQVKKEEARPVVRVSTPICYDDAFPDVCTPLFKNGSELLMNLTDDSWSQKKCAEYQHFVASAFRAIELRTTLARSTNSGYTSVVLPTGKILADLPLFSETAGFFKIPIYRRTRTTYSILGNWLPKLLLAVLLALGAREWLRLGEPSEARSERKKPIRIKKSDLPKKGGKDGTKKRKKNKKDGK